MKSGDLRRRLQTRDGLLLLREPVVTGTSRSLPAAELADRAARRIEAAFGEMTNEAERDVVAACLALTPAYQDKPVNKRMRALPPWLSPDRYRDLAPKSMTSLLARLHAMGIDEPAASASGPPEPLKAVPKVQAQVRLGYGLPSMRLTADVELEGDLHGWWLAALAAAAHVDDDGPQIALSVTADSDSVFVDPTLRGDGLIRRFEHRMLTQFRSTSAEVVTKVCRLVAEHFPEEIDIDAQAVAHVVSAVFCQPWVAHSVDDGVKVDAVFSPQVYIPMWLTLEQARTIAREKGIEPPADETELRQLITTRWNYLCYLGPTYTREVIIPMLVSEWITGYRVDELEPRERKRLTPERYFSPADWRLIAD